MIRRILVLVLALCPAALDGARGADAFTPQCLPYQQIAKKRPIDATCPPEGQPASPAHSKEYVAKNNLCAAGPAIDITLADLVALQKAAEDAGVPIGQRDTPVPDRATLKNLPLSDGRKIGEGDLVRLVAYITDAKATGARHSDGTAGEGVNCKQFGAAMNDIHIDVGGSPTAPGCSGIVSEMIPHFRPAAWTPQNLRKTESIPIRMTGHLFLDSRHNVSTCSRPSPGDPPRVSLWEIHPVYAVDVCKSKRLSDCIATRDSMWVPLDQWVATPEARALTAPAAKHPQRAQMRHE